MSLFVWSMVCELRAQPPDSKCLTIRLSVGVGHFASYDRLLNSYAYTGDTPYLFRVRGSYQKNRTLLILCGFTAIGEMTPGNLDDLPYEYNYVEGQYYRLDAGYFYKISASPGKTGFYLGAGIASGLYLQQEYYQGLLDAYGRGYRKAYTFSPVSLSLNLLWSYRPEIRHTLGVTGAYSPVSCVARPTDNHVKQLYEHERPDWFLFFSRRSIAYRASLFYNYRLTAGVTLTLEMETLYQHYDYRDAYAFRSYLFMAGIQKSFK